jgi:S1-C subfamily serine protease
MSLLQQISQELEVLIARASPAVVSVEHRQGQGSGFLIAPDGYVLTNAHVVLNRASARVGLAGGDEIRARVVGQDEQTDVAILKIEGSGLPSLPLADDRRAKVGQLVVAVGNPLHFERSVSFGVVSALDRALGSPGGHLFEDLIQTDAAINPGNSGGPLLDAQGAVLGVNTAAIPYAQGIGFAIPSHTASWVAAVLIHEGAVRRPYLGIAARSSELAVTAARTSGQLRAVRIFDIGANTPADRAGLKKDDLLLSANGQRLNCIDDLQRVMVLSRAEELRLEVLRGETARELLVRPAPRKAA